MSILWPPSSVWANVPVYYRVIFPEGREPLYEWAAPVALSMAVVSGGLWLIRGRPVRTGNGRALLWAAFGCLAVSYSAWWLWEGHYEASVESGWGTWAAVFMPFLWGLACAAVILLGRGLTHPADAPERLPSKATAERDVALESRLKQDSET